MTLLIEGIDSTPIIDLTCFEVRDNQKPSNWIENANQDIVQPIKSGIEAIIIKLTNEFRYKPKHSTKTNDPKRCLTTNSTSKEINVDEVTAVFDPPGLVL